MTVTEAATNQERIKGDFTGKSIVSVGQFERPDTEALMAEAAAMAQITEEQGAIKLLEGLVVANLFYEPSTRTFLSFEAAAKRLGAATISTQGVEFSSIAKGETTEDTVRTVSQCADTIVMRHGVEGSANIAASVSEVPIINAGDGKAEHPTQALLDLYTIKKRFGRIDGLTVSLVGDLQNGRTVHSLAGLLGLYDVQLNYVSPSELEMPRDIVDRLDGQVGQHETTELDDVIGDTDVLYMTRIQKERFGDPAAYERLKDAYILDPAVMARAKDDMAVMHPLPRNREIHPDVDKDPRAIYFPQVKNGMHVRMGLLALVNGRAVAV